MQILFVLGAGFYVLMMPILVASWLNFFRHDTARLSSEEKQVSLLVILIAALLWPLVLPIAYLELLDRFQRSTRAAELYQKMLEVRETDSYMSSDEMHFSKH